MTYSSNPISSKTARIGATFGAAIDARNWRETGAKCAPWRRPRRPRHIPRRSRGYMASSRHGGGLAPRPELARELAREHGAAVSGAELDARRAARRAMATPDGAAYDAELVIYRLEEAGTTLLSIPDRGYTTKLRSSSLDIVRSALEAYGWAERAIRPAVPSAAKIDRMDEALSWIPLIPVDKYVLRRIVGARCLVSPLTERNLYPWRRLAAALGADHKAIQRWHAQGIDLIVDGSQSGERA